MRNLCMSCQPCSDRIIIKSISQICHLFNLTQTTVVQLLSVILQRQLTVVNCHGSTETSDLLGGFRPVRARQNIVHEMAKKAETLVTNWADLSFNIKELAPPFIIHYSQLQEDDLPSDSSKQTVEFLRTLYKKYRHSSELSTNSLKPKNDKSSSRKKRQKLSDGKVGSVVTPAKPPSEYLQLVESTYIEVEALYKRYSALFEWEDGPLVCSMKEGSLLLLDEISLAEDAVLERLNSVLEPSRTLTLAEKGGEGPACVHEMESMGQLFSSEVKAQDNFRIFATMNPGGDFGKRELSPALRSRFTEIWVPSVSHRSDIDLVLEKFFLTTDNCDLMDDAGVVRKMILDYFAWFNLMCDDPTSFCNDFKLSLRDVLSWARFIAETFQSKAIDQYSSYAHGASLMHLDGLGLGTGVSNQDATAMRNKAKAFLMSQILEQGKVDVVGFQDELKEIDQSIVSTADVFGIAPFTIPTGSEQIPSELGFNLTAPTTVLNLRRVLRGLQIAKPILLEGSPGVGKTR